jgi:hypothetical protein
VKCDSGLSCHGKTSDAAWITVLGLFLFPGALCLCCLACMSPTVNGFLRRASGYFMNPLRFGSSIAPTTQRTRRQRGSAILLKNDCTIWTPLSYNCNTKSSA